MDALLMFAAEIVIIGVAFWVVATEVKSPAEIARILDTPPQTKKPRFADLAPAIDRPVVRPGRPGARR